MKNGFIALALLCALAFPMSFAADETKAAAEQVKAGPAESQREGPSMEERLLEVEIRVKLEHYGKVIAGMRDDRLKSQMEERSPAPEQEERA
jgi:hypothetical protein